MADKTFTAFEPDDVVSGLRNKVTYPMWSGDVAQLTSFYTASAQDPFTDTVGKYYLDVYNTDPQSDDTAAVQFSIAYGHVSGSGSLSTDYDYPTKSIYGAYQGALLSNPEELFQLDSVAFEDAFFISLKRARYKYAIDPGNWELTISGSGGIITITDDSEDTTNNISLSNISNTYNIVSGSITGGIANSTKLGILYPAHGVIVLSTDAISGSIDGLDKGVDAYKANHYQLLKAMDGGNNFTARSLEEIKSTYYFIRVKNKEYNYTNNPTLYSGSTDSLRFDEFYDDPKTFITTVGLYNDNNDLVAVAKMSQPVKKSKTNEVTIQARLDF